MSGSNRVATERRGAGTRRPLRRVGALAAAVACAPLLVAACGTTGSAARGHGMRAASTVAPAAPRSHVHESIVASAVVSDVPIYRSPRAARPFLRLASPTPVGEPLVFLVARRGAGWEQVYLPRRPDGATGWVMDRDVDLAWNPYSLRVSLRAHELVVLARGHVLARYRAAVGRSVLPTPRGRYYLVELLKQPDPNGLYGPYAFGTSAFSRVLYSFGGGPGQIGLHGTNDPGSIGRSVSHGCIRVPNAAIVRLAHELPLGTPVTIER